MKVGDKIVFTGCKPGCSCEMGVFAPGDPFFKLFQDRAFVIDRTWRDRHDIVSCIEVVAVESVGFHDEDMWGGKGYIFLAAHVSLCDGG